MIAKVMACLAVLSAVALPTEIAAQPNTAAAPKAARFSVESTPIGDILRDAKAKAVLELHAPELKPYYDQLQLPTLAQVAPQSNGLLTDAKLKAIQADFDKLD